MNEYLQNAYCGLVLVGICGFCYGLILYNLKILTLSEFVGRGLGALFFLMCVALVYHIIFKLGTST